MKHYTYTKSLGIMIGILLLSACDSGAEDSVQEEEAPEEESNSTGEAEENSAEEDVTEEGDSVEETPESEENEEHAYQIVTEDEVFDESSIQALVNRQYLLSRDYVPHDLVPVEVPMIFPDHLPSSESNDISSSEYLNPYPRNIDDAA